MRNALIVGTTTQTDVSLVPAGPAGTEIHVYAVLCSSEAAQRVFLEHGSTTLFSLWQAAGVAAFVGFPFERGPAGSWPALITVPEATALTFSSTVDTDVVVQVWYEYIRVSNPS